MIKSIFVILIPLSALCQSLAIVFAKMAANTAAGNSGLLSLYLNVFYLLSMFFLGLQGVTWIFVLKKFDLSFAYPFLSITLFYNIAFSRILFNEPVGLNKWIGIIVIALGMVVMLKDVSSNGN